ncbi:Hypothetical protein CINCED_3A010476 [Cinara cedri]|uniref:Uncharacterized protein n=1 Tax=Cinara cedri TaxID=506608 RepID=A0A5E4MAV3_9HEMI|nr:Hypothetical protein CINCED_3A010476 [Cinara cedri]
MSSLENKLDFWIKYVDRYNNECFTAFNDFLKENEQQVTSDVEKNIHEHLIILKKSLKEYFPEKLQDMNWLQNPFANHTKPSMLIVSEYEILINIKCSSSLKQKFKASK